MGEFDACAGPMPYARCVEDLLNCANILADTAVADDDQVEKEELENIVEHLRFFARYFADPDEVPAVATLPPIRLEDSEIRAVVRTLDEWTGQFGNNEMLMLLLMVARACADPCNNARVIYTDRRTPGEYCNGNLVGDCRRAMSLTLTGLVGETQSAHRCYCRAPESCAPVESSAFVQLRGLSAPDEYYGDRIALAFRMLTLEDEFAPEGYSMALVRFGCYIEATDGDLFWMLRPLLTRISNEVFGALDDADSFAHQFRQARYQFDDAVDRLQALTQQSTSVTERQRNFEELSRIHANAAAIMDEMNAIQANLDQRTSPVPATHNIDATTQILPPW